jgi:histidyl-tRNA synthetase
MSKEQKIITKPLSGFMELKPSEQILFNEMKKIIEKNYKLFGFIPMDNPLIERKEVLFAKAGGETETQIYELKKGNSELALRFDLTVPLARYVADKYGDLTFPFKRYQIAKVYRGERPQAGRFREFYQADIDIIGNESLDLNFDSEIPATIAAVFNDLGLDNFTIRINNRKIFSGFFEELELEAKASNVMQLIDKVEKIGKDSFIGELKKIDLDPADIKGAAIINLLYGDSDSFSSHKESNMDVINKLKDLGIKNEKFNKGVEELELVITNLISLGVDKKHFEIDLTIARGLDYYTGTVYETRLNDYPEIGSVCSGGRYDDLASEYTNRRLPGVGISIGLSRLFDQLLKKEVIKTDKSTYTKILVIALDKSAKDFALDAVSKLRGELVPSEIDLNCEKNLKKRTKYADKLGIPFVMFIGEDEVNNGTYVLKDFKTGEELKNLSFEQIIKKIKN